MQKNRIIALAISTGLSVAGCTTVDGTLATLDASNPASVQVSVPVTVGAEAIQSPLLCDGTMRYRPLPAFPALNYTDYAFKNNTLTPVDKVWPATNAEINKLLPNIASAISVDVIDGSGDVILVKGKARRERVTIDFMKYRSEPVKDNSGSVFLYSRIGAGLRLTINLLTADAELDTGSLIAIAVSAKAGLTRGSITADIIGMDASEITLAMPFTSDVSEGSIQQIIEALSVIKAKLHDSKTELRPQFIARIDCMRLAPAPTKK